MQRFVTLALILVFSIPVGLSVSGCSKGGAVAFCNGGSSGQQEGQINNIDLEPRLYGISLNYGSIGQISSPNATDCKGDSVGVVRYTYGTTNINYVDVSPSGGICAGTWNRNTPGGVADFTTCSPPATQLPLPSFSTPTTPTPTTGSTSTLNYAVDANGINGTIKIAIGAGPVLTGVIANTTSAATFATAFNAVSAFSTAGLVATASGNTVTITGPVGGANMLSFTGTSLAGSGYVPAGYVTASAGGAVSNPVPVYVHPIVTSVQLASQASCLSQGTSTPLIAVVNGTAGTTTDITAFAGPLNFAPQDGSVVSINSTVVPPIATAQLPGSTIISASTSNASSPAGIFFTCPPKSITLSVPGTSATSISLNQNTPQALTTVVKDTAGVTITGLNLEYISTNPRTVSASSGSITAIYPGSGAITAVCQPGSCNPAPLQQVGLQRNGIAVTSNPIDVTTPGTVNTVLYIASTGSQYFTNIDFSTNTVGSPVRLPYMPNSMISDQAGQTLFFGSQSELMEVSTLTNTVIKEDASVKGTVVGVSNDGSELVISDAVHNLIYIYTVSGGSSISFGGTATHAQFTPDNQSIYITGTNSGGTDNFWVYSNFDGWHTYTLSPAPVDVAVTVPGIGAYLAQTANITQRTYCPLGAPPTDYYPQVDAAPLVAAADRIAFTNDSKHVLSASSAFNLLTDIPVTLKSSISVAGNPGACSATPSQNGFTNGGAVTAPLGVVTTSITGVEPSADSSLAFVTYTTASVTTTGTKLPYYKPGTGTGGAVVLTNGASAAVSGIFSPDGKTFYTGTASDNDVHLIDVPTLTDTRTILPALPACAVVDAVGNCTTLTGGTAVPNLLANRPRPTT